MDALCATQGDRLVVILGGVADTDTGKAAQAMARFFGPGPVVAGPRADDLASAHVSARSAIAGLRAAIGWPDAPRPVASDDLLPERVLAGDGHARRHLVESVFGPLSEARGTLVETLTAYFQHGASLEATARALFVHPNTVRYRLRQVAELTGLSATHPREGLTLQLALVLGRQAH
jgi:DNA-binding PucR family transcriptional regulator